ncbi:MAG TPA: hypothetical protein VFR85_18665 [Anaeromyxobacteraceae bacterium]|nr:hypothetical protein [Anaeromyxobacteraceae bacterium]
MATRSARRTGLWLLAAALLLAATALVAMLSEEGGPVPARAAVEFPTQLRGPEYLRMNRRATLPPLPQAGSPAAAPPERKRDPLLWALPPGPAGAVVVFEANALRHSRLGELFLGCLGESEKKDLDELRRMGIDPLKDVDRVAVMPKGLAVSGFFDKVSWDQVFHGFARERYGSESVLYEDPGRGRFAAAVWRSQLIVLGPDPDAVRAAVDRVEGRAPATPPIAEDATYGEVYGVVPGEALRALVPPGTPGDLARRLAEVASRVELHADAMSDVAVTARVSGEDRAALEDLARALGAALAVGRMEARASGERELAELLDHARVARGGEGFSLELALPAELLERWFAGCRDRVGAEPGRPAGEGRP